MWETKVNRAPERTMKDYKVSLTVHSSVLIHSTFSQEVLTAISVVLLHTTTSFFSLSLCFSRSQESLLQLSSTPAAWTHLPSPGLQDSCRPQAGGSGTYPCRYCNRYFTNITERSSHEKLHQEIMTKWCLYYHMCHLWLQVQTRQHLKRHFDAVHRKIKHPCSDCNKLFSQRESLLRHQKYCTLHLQKVAKENQP